MFGLLLVYKQYDFNMWLYLHRCWVAKATHCLNLVAQSLQWKDYSYYLGAEKSLNVKLSFHNPES